MVLLEKSYWFIMVFLCWFLLVFSSRMCKCTHKSKHTSDIFNQREYCQIKDTRVLFCTTFTKTVQTGTNQLKTTRHCSHEMEFIKLVFFHRSFRMNHYNSIYRKKRTLKNRELCPSHNREVEWQINETSSSVGGGDLTLLIRCRTTVNPTRCSHRLLRTLYECQKRY